MDAIRLMARLGIVATCLSVFHASSAWEGGVQGRGEIRGQSHSVYLPGRAWTFSARPGMQPGTEYAPVHVFSVTTAANRGLTVRRVGLRNRSAKQVVGIKIGWYLDTEQAPKTVLINGESPFIRIEGGLRPGGECQLTTDVVSFGEVSKRLNFADVGLSAIDFVIHVEVTDVLSEGGARWPGYWEGMIVSPDPGKTLNCANCPHTPCAWSFVKDRWICNYTNFCGYCVLTVDDCTTQECDITP